MASARRRFAVAGALLAALAAALAWSGSAAAEYKDYLLGPAQIAVQVDPDGSLDVRETIGFSFIGHFTGAYRDIPLRKGESIDRIAVSDTAPAEPVTVYKPGASAELGSSGDPGTFGVARLKDRVRIVWHFASDSLRTFTIAYRFRGLAVAYDDVVDVNMQVWGKQWPKGVSSVAASIALPTTRGGPQIVPLRVWGHPATVKGTTALVPGAAVLTTSYVKPHQFVELRTLFPRSLLDSTAGAKVVAGPGLAKIVAAEKQAVDDREYGRRQVQDALDNLPRTIVFLVLLAVGPALALIWLVWLVYGREPKTGYDREYEQQPPSDLKPALVLPLVEEQKSPTSLALAFTATLFDLIRRGDYKATPTTTKLHGKEVSDLQLAQGNRDGLVSFEEPVADVVDEALEDGPVALSGLSGRVVAARATNAKRFLQFSARLGLQIVQRKWYAPGSGGAILGWSIPAFIVVGVVLIVVSVHGFDSAAPLWSDIVMLVLGLACFPNAIVAAVGAAHVKLWRRRTKEAQLEAERWEAFRRYLRDFPRLEDAPPATLALWDSYLVYGIAFGIAERVLAAAHLHMPTALQEQSAVYWISSSPDLGSGATALGISSIASELESALTPVSTSSGSSSSGSSSGFGGSFSSSGGGGGGGGGGGAW